MIVCLAGLESEKKYYPEHILKYGLTSFLYIKTTQDLNYLLTKVDNLLVDSGAHSLQHGAKIDIDEFCEQYIQFIKENENNPHILGFFELDVDNVYGYEKILSLRRKLETVSNKIIPVWHNNRGIDEFVNMCKEYSGKRVAITGFANNDIKDSQYNYFINTAHKYGCTIHLLGLTRFELIENLNLGLYDSVDSSSWIQSANFGRISIPINRKLQGLEFFKGLRVHHRLAKIVSFMAYKKIQEDYLDVDKSVFVKSTH